jgi:hypothetical protein
MEPVREHHPGPPQEPEPPEALIALSDNLQHPLVMSSGITTTTDGRWALYVTVPADAVVPIAGVEKKAGRFPVVYEAAPAELPIAKPAYPLDERKSPKPPRR